MGLNNYKYKIIDFEYCQLRSLWLMKKDIEKMLKKYIFVTLGRKIYF